MQLADYSIFEHINAPVTAGSSIDDDSAGVDIAGFDGVVFITPITDSVATGVATATISQNTINNTSGMAALSGAVATATCATNDDINSTLLIVDVYKPRERYLFSTLTSATANIAYGDTIAIKYKGRTVPTAQAAAEVSSIVKVVSPAEA